jgi:Zn-dependent protease with chaperone function
VNARRLIGATLLALGAVASLPAATQTLPSVGPAAAAEQDYLAHDYLFVDSPELQTYLQSIVAKLLAGRTERFAPPQVLLYSTESFNAAADTAGNLLITTQTLRMLESEDELAALLGHELTHVVMGHPNKKSFMQSFPAGVESLGAIAAAGDQMRQIPGGASPGQSEFAQTSVAHTQNLGLFWADLLAPNWNRKQEREADRTGLDMMRASGYDPAAFATLFSKLHAAQLKRSARMEVLRKEMVGRAQKPQVNLGGQVPAEFAKTVNDLQGAAMAKAIDAGFDELMKSSNDYDSPEERQGLLAQYLEQVAPGPRDKTARSPLFAQNTRSGAGGTLLHLDEQAIAALNALGAGDQKAAAAAMADLLPPPARAPAPAKAPARAAAMAPAAPAAKEAPAPAPARAFARPVSAHLNLALGTWYQAQGDVAAGDAHALDWLATTRAPAAAFRWHAANQATAKEYAAAIATLEAAGTRLAEPGPFLPEMIGYAKLDQDTGRAERLTLQCKDEEQKRKASVAGKVTSLVRGAQPTGLYADCLRALGYMPAGGELQRGLMNMVPLLKK